MFMIVPLTFRDKNGFPYKRDGADVLYAVARGQNCELYFENGDFELYGYPLNFFHQKVWVLNLFRRLGKFLLVKVGKIKNHKWLEAVFSSGKILKLTRSANERLKAYRLKHPPSQD